MRKFDTKIQHLKYKVLREVARLAWEVVDIVLLQQFAVHIDFAPGKIDIHRLSAHGDHTLDDRFFVESFLPQNHDITISPIVLETNGVFTLCTILRILFVTICKA